MPPKANRIRAEEELLNEIVCILFDNIDLCQGFFWIKKENSEDMTECSRDFEFEDRAVRGRESCSSLNQTLAMAIIMAESVVGRMGIH